MAYSRGSRRSRLYTFWCIDRQDYPEPEDRDNVIFRISGIADFKSKELRQNLNQCFKIIEEKAISLSVQEILQLYQDIKAFLAEVDEKYPEEEN